MYLWRVFPEMRLQRFSLEMPLWSMAPEMHLRIVYLVMLSRNVSPVEMHLRRVSSEIHSRRCYPQMHFQGVSPKNTSSLEIHHWRCYARDLSPEMFLCIYHSGDAP